MSSFIKTIAFNNPRKLISNVFIRTFTKAELPQFETLAVSVPKKHVYHVELNRPKKSNSFSRTMWQEINQCFTTLSLIPECRVIVLSGQGKHFCGGIELQSLVQLAAEADELEDIVGNSSVARELCFTGRNFDAKEAKEIGLVSEVFPDKET
ncbi:hypothetical protein HF086_002593 [Spodoptera exigua]|uniref:Enoyl-CoA hydratase n=1 Tax=Spodoptera exigua TaxID=7107 RepID=A0A922MGN0_SPOEX|nr:hypothetical protein HF086_002593 [Spodoptera exigua]